MEKQLALYDSFPIYGYEGRALISKEKGCVTIPLQLALPEVFTLEVSDYVRLNELFFNIIDILGPNTLLHRQDYFFNEVYTPTRARLQGDFLERANEFHFNGRSFLRASHYLYISIVPKGYLQYSSKRANAFLTKKRDFYLQQSVPEDFIKGTVLPEFETKVESVKDLINASGLVSATVLKYEELFSNHGLYGRYFGLSSQETVLSDIDFQNSGIQVGCKKAQFFTLENLDQFTKEYISTHETYGKFSSKYNQFPVGNLFSIGFKIPYEHIINQYIHIPEQEKVLKQLRKKAKRFNQFSNGKKDDGNSIYADQIEAFNKDVLENHKEVVFYHLNVLAFGEKPYEYPCLCNAVSSAFKKLRINVKENTIDRKNLFFAGVPGNAVGMPSDMYMPMSSDMAASLLYFEGEYKDGTSSVNGVRLVDRITGRPLSVSVYELPEKHDWIFNRGMLVASGSGGGKSFMVNHYIASELRKGGEAVIMEDGNSYDKLTEVFGGTIIQHDDQRPFTFNPFLLDGYDCVLQTNGKKKLTENKTINLVTLLKLITGDEKPEGTNSLSSEVKNTVFEMLITYYYQAMWKTENPTFNFNGFFEFCNRHIHHLMESKGISKEIFDSKVFLFLLEKYYKDGPRGKLLNHKDERITRLSDEKIVYFKLGKLIDNELLFPITALMIMEIFSKKLNDRSKLSINKMMVVDEAWKALDRKELVDYFNSQSRMARKYGGQPIFISQKVDDFIASETIKNAIVVNSNIKVFLDMRDFAKSFDNIQAVMGLGKNKGN